MVYNGALIIEVELILSLHFSHHKTRLAHLFVIDEAPMTPEAEDWLAFQAATTYGLDIYKVRD